MNILKNVVIVPNYHSGAEVLDLLASIVGWETIIEYATDQARSDVLDESKTSHVKTVEKESKT
jgi:hypothetical protein